MNMEMENLGDEELRRKYGVPWQNLKAFSENPEIKSLLQQLSEKPAGKRDPNADFADVVLQNDFLEHMSQH